MCHNGTVLLQFSLQLLHAQYCFMIKTETSIIANMLHMYYQRSFPIIIWQNKQRTSQKKKKIKINPRNWENFSIIANEIFLDYDSDERHQVIHLISSSVVIVSQRLLKDLLVCFLKILLPSDSNLCDQPTNQSSACPIKQSSQSHI